MPSRKLLFLYSTPNIVGCGLGLFGLLLYFTGIISDYWLLIVIGLYGIGVLLTPRNETVLSSISQSLDAETLAAELKKMHRKADKRLSQPVRDILDRLMSTLIELIPHLKRYDGSSYQLHSVKKTVTEYLPELLQTYLKLPAAYARFHSLSNGKTPRDVLVGQLELLDSEMNKVLSDILKDDVDSLVTHGRFLEDKFGTQENRF